jgi:hypothetical protein
MKQPTPAKRRFAVVTAVAGIVAAVVPIVAKLAPHGAAHLNTAVFIAGLGIGLSFTLAVGMLVQWRRGCSGGVS